MATATKEKPATFSDNDLWQQQLIDQLADIDPADFTHVVYSRNGETARLIATYPDETAAVLAAAELAENGDDDEVSVVPATELHAFIDRQAGQDPDAGKLFDVPRVGIVVDETDPTVIKLAFSGGIDLDRGIANDVEFYNRLAAGKTVNLEVSAHVAGSKITHRRDSDGNVDAVVQTKSLIVHSIDEA